MQKKKSRACRPSRGFYHKRHRLISFDCNFFFLSLSPVTLHFTIFYISLISPPHFSHRQRERERVDSESRCFLLTTISLITRFAFLWYSLSLSLSLSILVMVKNWIEMRGFPNKDFAILMFEILLFARFFFFCFFFKRARSSSVFSFFC